ncbi:MAG TPA: NADH-quinone oxidoreductase subunit J [Acidimicrobiales bacterium]|nr:NADH-quinone oxidoreductase subunit J [Acidimicrobiales bacterium]
MTSLVLSLVSLAAARATVPDVITFVVGAVLVLAGAVGVVTSRNPVHAALSLIATLFGVAVLFVEENANFIAAVQVIVYAGAIVVLFLFVIMFLGVDRRENLAAEPLRGQRPLAFVLMVVALGCVLAMAASAHWVTGARTVTGPIDTRGRPEVAQLGTQLFTRYLFAFEATAALLVIAVVGAVVLARRPPSPAEPDAASTPERHDVPAGRIDGGPAGGAEAAPLEGAAAPEGAAVPGPAGMGAPAGSGGEASGPPVRRPEGVPG